MTAALTLMCIGCGPGTIPPLGLGPQGDDFVSSLALLAIGIGLYVVFAKTIRYRLRGQHRDAETIVRERYARGELSADEFNRLMQDLSKTR